MAFGKIGLDRETFWDMTPREFFNAWIGYAEKQNEKMEAIRDITFGAARYNAANTAFSGEAQRKIARKKFPWEKRKKGETPEFIDYDSMKGMFEGLTEDNDGS